MGPQVYGYTLNQQMTPEQLQGFTDSGKRFVGTTLKLYHPPQHEGRLLGLYVDYKRRLDTVTSTSQGFVSESDCQVAQQADEAQLKTLIDDFNSQQARPAGAPRQLGDVYASQSTDVCQRIGGQVPEAATFRYTIWTTLQTETMEPGQTFPRKVESTTSEAQDIATIIVLVPILVVASAMIVIGTFMKNYNRGPVTEGTCIYFESPKECDKRLHR